MGGTVTSQGCIKKLRADFTRVQRVMFYVRSDLIQALGSMNPCLDKVVQAVCTLFERSV
jgi:hypothetical protein